MNIILYSTGCPKCKVLKKKLEDKSIDYTENNDIEKMTELGIMQVPILSVNNELMSFTQAVEWINRKDD